MKTFLVLVLLVGAYVQGSLVDIKTGVLGGQVYLSIGEEEEQRAQQYDVWTRTATGCTCYFDKGSKECACCQPGGCQCSEFNLHQCVECDRSEMCGREQSYDRWTRTATGCSCYFNKGSKVCACCYSGGCQCSESNLHQCVECNHGENCGRAQPYDRWTTTPTGCSCYFNKSSTECACCEPGGCQCSESNLHQCVECDRSEMCGRDMCPPGFTHVPETGRCYKVIRAFHDWPEADENCRLSIPGSHLVAIETEAENVALKGFLQSHISSHAGDNACKPTYWSDPGNLFWTSGQRVNENDCESQFVWKLASDTMLAYKFTNWVAGEPNCGASEESCMNIVEKSDYFWNDLPCYIRMCPVCEYRPSRH